MGAQATKQENKYGNLSKEEVSHLTKIYHSISKTEKNIADNRCPHGAFQKYCEKYLDDWLARRLADKISVSVKNGKNSELHVLLPNFLNFVSTMLKEPLEEKVELIWHLISDDEKDEEIYNASAEDILQYIRSITESYLKSAESSKSSQSWSQLRKMSSDSISEFSYNLLVDLFYKDLPPKSILSQKTPIKSEFSKEDFSHTLAKSPILLKLHNSVFSQCFSLDESKHSLNLIPYNLTPFPNSNASTPTEFTTLDLLQVLFINYNVPESLRSQWRFVYSTALHGESFSKFLSLIQDKGPTIIIIKEDKVDDRVFGLFANSSWAIGPKFFGTHQSFLFHLSPKMITYSSTGYNENYQYLNMNQQTLPNGIGLGGKLEYFGLFLDQEFGKGKCAPTCTTFQSAQLSVKEDFHFSHLEAWALGPEPIKDENERESKSILDKNPEAKAMMEMMGKKAASEGYRDESKN